MLSCILSASIYLGSTYVHQQSCTADVAKCLPSALTRGINKDLVSGLGERERLAAFIPNNFSGNSGHFESPSSVASPTINMSLMPHSILESTSVFCF